jgi:thioredoxin reductase (NADPH)
VIGSGTAGLAAAAYAASEGLSVLVVDGAVVGGQAGASARIENYLGFPNGISGQALTGRALNQAQKFGAEVAIPLVATRLECHASDATVDDTIAVTLADQGSVRARSWSPPVPATDGQPWLICGSSKATASTTGPRR